MFRPVIDLFFIPWSVSHSGIIFNKFRAPSKCGLKEGGRVEVEIKVRASEEMYKICDLFLSTTCCKVAMSEL